MNSPLPYRGSWLRSTRWRLFHGCERSPRQDSTLGQLLIAPCSSYFQSSETPHLVANFTLCSPGTSKIYLSFQSSEETRSRHCPSSFHSCPEPSGGDSIYFPFRFSGPPKCALSTDISLKGANVIRNHHIFRIELVTFSRPFFIAFYCPINA